MDALILTPLVVSLALILLAYLLRPHVTVNRLPLPPGPRGLPIIGNLLDIPADHYWLKLDEWAQEYGPIYTIYLLTKPIIILSSPKTAADLFDRRSAIYSDRPRWVLASEILARGMHVGTMRAGETHRIFRKAIHAGLQPKALSSYHPTEEHEARVFLKQVAQSPEDFRNCVKRYSAAIIMATIFGHQVSTFNEDRFAKRIFSSAAIYAGSLAPGAFLVDMIPWLKYVPSWLPGAGWKAKAERWAEDDGVLYTEMLETARAHSNSLPSFISEGLTGRNYGVNDEQLAYIGGTISQTPDTLMSVMSGFMLAMTRWPEIQRKAQAEIDREVGHGRFPFFADRANLPYTTAVVKETCRWRPVAPLSVPHASTKDDEYMGYRIPKGTTIISSIWSIHRDAEVYPNPDSFIPERFLDEQNQTKNTEESRALGHHLYGFGRRLCPGAILADQAIWVFAVHCLWGLELRRPLGVDGDEMIPDVRPQSFTSGGEASHPLPFKCDIWLRSGVSELLENVETPQSD